MRVLMTRSGYPGHVLPLVPFARAWVQAGDEVCIAGPRATAAMVRDVGLDFCGFPDPPPERVGGIIAAAAGLAPGEGHALMIARDSAAPPPEPRCATCCCWSAAGVPI